MFLLLCWIWSSCQNSCIHLRVSGVNCIHYFINLFSLVFSIVLTRATKWGRFVVGTLPQSEVDYFCNGFVADLLHALAHLHRWTSGYNSDQNGDLEVSVASRVDGFPSWRHEIAVFADYFFDLFWPIHSEPTGHWPFEHFVFDLAETLAQRLWDALTTLGTGCRTCGSH